MIFYKADISKIQILSLGPFYINLHIKQQAETTLTHHLVQEQTLLTKYHLTYT